MAVTNHFHIAKPIMLGSLLATIPLTGAHAADESAAPESGWEFSITPYLWMSGEKGEVGVIPETEPVDLDLSFGDIFHNLKFAAMGIVQARKGRFVAMTDIAYVKVGASKGIGIRDPDFLEAEIDTSTFTATAAGGYRAVDNGPTFLDVMGGMRLSSSTTELELTGPVRSVSGKKTETWVDPVIAARFHAPLSDKWAVVVYGDIGGFGIASDLTWQLQGAVQYRIGRSWWLDAGWRQYAIDYEKSDFIYDVKLGGPILGVSYRF